jgi:S-phase kinase-associated protein 1
MSADEKNGGEAVLGLDEPDGDEQLVLVSQEQEKFTVSQKVAMMSELVKTVAEGDKEEKEIPLPNVKGTILSKVVQYMRYHCDNPAQEIEKPLKSANMAEVVSHWDADFVDVDQELLFELILAANYMDIKPLLDLTCAKVASMIKGKTPEQIRKTFNIQNDFTPEEEEAVRAENKWAEES